MHGTLTRLAASAGLLLVLVAPALLSPALVTPAQADTITDWNQIALAASAASPPLPQNRAMAITHGAMFDAVNAVTRTHRPALVQPAAVAGASPEAAAAAAAHAVLVALYPGQKPVLDWSLETSLARADAAGREAGAQLGRDVAARHLASRADDGMTRQVTFTPGTSPGQWRPTPPANTPFGSAFWAQVTPFVLASASEVTAPGPLPIDSPAYAAELAEVRRLGAWNSKERTADQTAAALFTLISGAELWGSAARTAIAARPVSLIDSARIFALMYAAASDSIITGWAIKVQHPTWRPITAIREAAVDPDPSWTPLLATPPHPDYLSGHCISSGAMAGVLRRLLGNDGVPFTASLVVPSGVFSRNFANFTAAETEIGNGRVWGGIHTRTPDDHGAIVGAAIAEIVVSRAMLPLQGARGEGTLAR